MTVRDGILLGRISPNDWCTVTSAPPTLDTLQVSLSIDDPSGPQVAAWRDEYLTRGREFGSLVELCVEDLHERRLCYSCGKPATRLVLDDFPRVCVACEPLA